MFVDDTQKVAVMIDIETLNTTVDSTIVSIAACVMDPNSDVHFYSTIELADSIINGRTISPETVKWWSKQDKDVASRTLSGTATNKKVAELLVHWLNELTNNGELTLEVWAKPSHFDIPIVEHWLRQFGSEVPWKHYNVRCLRTFFDVKNYKPRKLEQGQAHDALADAQHQVREFFSAYNEDHRHFKNIVNELEGTRFAL